MAEFVQALHPETPHLLFHYTNPANIMNMLDTESKSVCFWLKNNKDKNDEKELKYGRELMEEVRHYLHSIGQPSMLDQITDFDNSYSASFTEGALDNHMLGEYGTARFEFDLRGYKEEIFKCEYYTEEDLAELKNVFISDIQSMEGVTKESRADLKWGKVFRMITLEWDLKSKIASIKLKDKWESEGEWRILLHKQEKDERYFIGPDGKERLKMFIPITFLKGITLFYDEKSKDKMKEFCRRIKEQRDCNKLGRFKVKLKRIKNSEV